jgi:hypothetical protein
MPRLDDATIFARISKAMTPQPAAGAGNTAPPATIQGLIDKAKQKQPAKVEPKLAPEQKVQMKALNTR